MGATCMVVVFALLAITSLCLCLAEIVMGSLHIKNCPAERHIPIFLLVTGLVQIVLAITKGRDVHNMRKRAAPEGGTAGQDRGYPQLQRGTEALLNQTPREKCWSSFRGLLSLFAGIWALVGMYWVLHVYRPISDPADALYCHPGLYSFALAIVFLRLAYNIVSFTLTICLCCGFICCAACMA